MKLKFTFIASIIILLIFSSCVIKEPDDIYDDGEGGTSTSVDFTANTTSIEPGGTVYFTNKSSRKYDNFYWDFGDGGYSYAEDPYHTYYSEGYYDVILYGWSSDTGEDDYETKYGYIYVGYGSGDFTAYAWNLWDGDANAGPVSINNGTLTNLRSDTDDFMAGGDWAQGNWYAGQYGTNYLYRISHTTGSKTYIGTMSINSVTGLAYDVTTNTMYVSDYNGASYLYSVNLNTGYVSYIGLIDDGLIIGIACNASGDLYGIHTSSDALYYINKYNGTGYIVGSLGININYAQDIAFDRNTGILWGALYVDADAKSADSDAPKKADGKGIYTGLYQIDLNTGYATEIYDVNAEMGALAIPHNY